MRLWMNLWTRATHRMDTKIYFTSLTFFLFVMLKVSGAQTPPHADQMQSVSNNMANSPTMPAAATPTDVTGSRMGSRTTRDADSAPETRPAEGTTRQSTSNPVNVTPTTSQNKTATAPKEQQTTKPQPKPTTTPASTVTSSPSTTKKTTAVARDWKWDKDFVYGEKLHLTVFLCLSSPSNAWREFLQIWHKLQLGLVDERIQFWWSKVTVTSRPSQS
ncbi:FXYD domain containing ion transport regulator 5 isoform X1 [Sebastes umbrosus]|uniref:FXYD domain containing ion transport regulator 5 isoform X1 n=1 Tax=Sebastes umbrosus TaxID=72105 RepID=UPI0018A04076|nr:FXYD domain containing ion transport regulator 5 isoform X1 [Sebastes umbrosus]